MSKTSFASNPDHVQDSTCRHRALAGVTHRSRLSGVHWVRPLVSSSIPDLDRGQPAAPSNL
jgi:hypothetical protein